jgi:hypothetical protein
MTLTNKETKYYEALNTLLNSEGFLEDCENGNFHSTVEWLREMRDNGYYKEWDTPPEERE